MTFSYTYNFANVPLDRVRFEIGDTDSEGYFLEDEEILGQLALAEDDWQVAVLASIRGIIGKLTRPSFTADWLKVDPKVALDGFRKLLAEKELEYGVVLGGGAFFESGSTDVTRSDVTDYVPRYVDDHNH